MKGKGNAKSNLPPRVPHVFVMGGYVELAAVCVNAEYRLNRISVLCALYFVDDEANLVMKTISLNDFNCAWIQYFVGHLGGRSIVCIFKNDYEWLEGDIHQYV